MTTPKLWDVEVTFVVPVLATTREEAERFALRSPEAKDDGMDNAVAHASEMQGGDADVIPHKACDVPNALSDWTIAEWRAHFAGEASK